jgi:hypothetical protein
VPATYELYFDIYAGSSSGLVLQDPWYVSPTLDDECYYWCFGALALVDLDHDGLDDLVLEVEDQCVFLKRTPGGFERAPQWWEPAAAGLLWNNRVLALTDVDLDGFEDLLLEGLRLHRGSASGFERSPAWWGTIDFPHRLLKPAADFDGNGRGELLQASSLSPYGLRVFEAFP